jgi:hypothetical protein
VAIDIRQLYTRPKRGTINTIKTGARHLHQSKPWRGRGHGHRKFHRDQDIDIGQLRYNGGLVTDYDLAG